MPTTREKLSQASQMICDHMFSYLKLDHTFHIFWLRTWIIFCYFSYVEISHLLQIREGIGIQFELIPHWIELTPAIILFPAQ